jgi:hypothetical protein
MPTVERRDPEVLVDELDVEPLGNRHALLEIAVALAQFATSGA